MVDTWLMCRQHLLAEHADCHKLANMLNDGRSIRGVLANGLAEIHSIAHRHEELVGELVKRGYNHESPLDFDWTTELGEVDRVMNRVELYQRCEICRERMDTFSLEKESLG